MKVFKLLGLGGFIKMKRVGALFEYSHNNIMLRFMYVEKGRVNLWSSSLYGRFHFHNCEKYYPNTMNNSPCGGFQSKWNVLPEHVEFASLGFIQLKLTLNLNKTIYLPHVLFWDSWCYKKVKIKVVIFKILKLIWFVESEKNTTY